MSPRLPGLRQDAFGRLVLSDAEGVEHVGVIPVRAFPIQAPGEAISLLDADGQELAWIERLDDCPEDQRTLLRTALEQREFMPLLKRLKSVSSFATPSTWAVETDRGDTRFVLKGEEQIRRLGPDLLIVSDADGVQYLIRDPASMDPVSRRLLDRFL